MRRGGGGLLVLLTDSGHHHEGERYEGDCLGCQRRVRLLHELPDKSLILGVFPISEVILVILPQLASLYFHLLQHGLLHLLILQLKKISLLTARSCFSHLAAGLQVDLINAPVSEIVCEGEAANVLLDVKLAGPVEVEDGVEGPRVTVKEISGEFFVFVEICSLLTRYPTENSRSKALECPRD